MEITKFASDLPYPDVKVKQNPQQSKLLMPSFGGAGGEITAVMTYAFQSSISAKYPDISKAMLSVAKVEMRHMKLLSDTIFKLGGYPIIGSRQYWNGSMANYTLDAKKFLEHNIASEEATIINYERTILNLDCDCVKLLIERIILDEEVHIKIFKKLLSELQNEKVL